MPSYVAVPDAPQYGGQGFLAQTTAPFEVGGDPARPQFQVRDLAPAEDSEQRLALLRQVDGLDGAPRSPGEQARDQFLHQARILSLDAAARATFDLNQEPQAVRQRYGNHTLGQGALLARRLVAAGTRVVVVRDRGWDHHVNVNRSLTYGFPPKLTMIDQTVSALIDDLVRTEQWEHTVVCLASEFGRTPRLNPAAGRDHWPRAHSVLLFGGGIRSGAVVGTTDARGEEPIEQPVSPADVFATLVAAMGGDVNALLHTPDGRPIRLVEEGAAPIDPVLVS
jgi:uncharacterized protein (DUF1501 family)